MERKCEGVKNMKIDYQDISAFIEMIVEEAESEGFSVSSIDELYVYLEDNCTKVLEIVKRN